MSFFRPDNLRAITNGRWLQRLGEAESVEGVGIDSRRDLVGKIFVAIEGERHDGHEFVHDAVQAGARLLLVDRDVGIGGLPEHVGVLRVDDTRRMLGRLALAYRRSLSATRVIGITGSSGKTTTKRLVSAALETTYRGTTAPSSYNNDIGVPLTLLNAQPHDKFIICEVGTSAPGEIGHLAAMIEPDLAVITSIGRAHLEGLGTVEDVAREKCALLAHLRDEGTAIVNADALHVRDHLKPVGSVVLYGAAADADLRLTECRLEGSIWSFTVNDRQRFKLALPGRHNAMNALAALAVARRLGVDDERIATALASVPPDAMRLTSQVVGSIEVCNDAYNANPDSTVAALETFIELAANAPRRVVVLGEMLELGEAGPGLHAEIGRHLIDVDSRRRLDHVVLIGPLTRHVAAEIGRVWPDSRFTLLDHLTTSAAREVATMLRPGDALLLKGSRGAALERLLDMMPSHTPPDPTALDPQFA